MLETTLLKVKHAGAEEARKLLPYILNTDVYSVERPACTEEKATNEEQAWENIINAGMSRSAFARLSAHAHKHTPPEQQAYCTIQDDYLFRSKVPLWGVERFQPTKAQQMKELYQCAGALEQEGLDFLEQGNIPDCLAYARKALETHTMLNTIRDEEMARCVRHAESALRKRYVQLEAKETIRLTVAVGAVHMPEHYTSFSHISDIRDAHDANPERMLNEALQQKASPEVLTSCLLTWCRYTLAQRQKEQRR